MGTFRARFARVAVSASAFVALGWAGVPPAAAHAVFQGATAVPPDADSAVTMHVPHERDEQTYNVLVVIALAAGWRPVACETKPTWTCELGASGDTPLVTFTKDEGAERAEDETFVFTVHSAGPGSTAAFPTQQVYNTGEGINWSGPPGSPEPAPLLRTVDVTVAPEPTPAPTPKPTPEPTPEPTAAAAQVAATVASPTPLLAQEAVPAALGEADDGGFPAAAGVVGVVALVAMGAVGAVYRFRRAGA